MAVISEIPISKISSLRIDAEYYKPELLKLSSNLKLNHCSKLHQIANVNGGKRLPKGEAFSVSGIPYIRVVDIGNGFIADDNVAYICERIWEQIKRYDIREKDILVTIVGNTVGLTGILDFDLGVANFTENCARIRDSKIPEGFLLAFLISKYGQFQVLREKVGTSQPKLSLERLRKFIIPIFGNSILQEVDCLVKKSSDQQKLSKSLYIQAQELLEKELGLDKLVLEKPKSYETSFSEVVNGGRVDGEFFHAKYTPILNSIINYKVGFSPLKSLVNIIQPNFKALNHKDEIFEYLEIGDVSILDGSYTTNLIDAIKLPANAKIKLSGGEVLVSQVRPTRGAIAIIDDELEKNTITSGAFFVFKMKEDIFREIIWLYLRIIKNVFEKYCGGTSYPTIDGHYLANFPVPLFQNELSLKIKGLVIQSKQAKKESELLLAQAKKQVEDLIEGAIL